ncbi:hypothetical protein BU16DRAFT_532896 [Lophium mytilinum]|uniref:Uncharacterized protein n=1 Tax=Lophium mytilinum TaxID=390894 RepID=A0A6A6RDB4_9PEZI|nr:hypothetical protein BU16DRAFT_532896 [Lophium mytilinum]
MAWHGPRSGQTRGVGGLSFGDRGSWQAIELWVQKFADRRRGSGRLAWCRGGPGSVLRRRWTTRGKRRNDTVARRRGSSPWSQWPPGAVVREEVRLSAKERRQPTGQAEGRDLSVRRTGINPSSQHVSTDAWADLKRGSPGDGVMGPLQGHCPVERSPQ